MSAETGVALEKTSGHIFLETEGLLRSASDRVAEARSAGSGRSKGYASLIVVVAGLIFQSGGIIFVGKLPAPEGSQVSNDRFSATEIELIQANLQRIEKSTADIRVIKQRVAPGMPIDASISAVEASAHDLQTVLLQRSKADGGNN